MGLFTALKKRDFIFVSIAIYDQWLKKQDLKVIDYFYKRTVTILYNPYKNE